MATRQELRRQIGLRMGQPFFRRFGTDDISATSGTTTTLVDTAHLKEVDQFWRGSFIYLPDTDEQREISAFANGTSTVTWLAPIASGVTTDNYEIWSTITPLEIHQAIDRAMREAWPDFYTGIISDDEVVITEDSGLDYDIVTNVTNAIKMLNEVYIVVPDSETGTVTTGGTNVQLIDSSATFTSSDVGKLVAIYGDDPSCLGDIRTVSARNSATQLTVSSAFSDTLDVGAKYRLLDMNDPYTQYIPWNNWMTDKIQTPTKLYFGTHPTGYEGFPLRLVYEAEYTGLPTDASQTSLANEFIFNHVLAYIYSVKLASAPASEVPNWEAMQKLHAEYVADYRKRNKMQHKPSQIRRFTGGQSMTTPFRY